MTPKQRERLNELSEVIAEHRKATMTPEERTAWLDKQRLCRKQFKAAPGYVRNPLRDYDRNAPCLCGRIGMKFKKCCLSSLPLFIPEAELADHEAVLRGEK